MSYCRFKVHAVYTKLLRKQICVGTNRLKVLHSIIVPDWKLDYITDLKKMFLSISLN